MQRLSRANTQGGTFTLAILRQMTIFWPMIASRLVATSLQGAMCVQTAMSRQAATSLWETLLLTENSESALGSHYGVALTSRAALWRLATCLWEARMGRSSRSLLVLQGPRWYVPGGNVLAGGSVIAQEELGAKVCVCGGVVSLRAVAHAFEVRSDSRDQPPTSMAE